MVFFLFLSLLGADEALSPAENEPAEKIYTREEWRPSIEATQEQLELLDLFAAATKFGGMKIKVPKELQSLPMRMIEGADELKDKGIELRVTELEFRNLKIVRDATPQWQENRPRMPVRLEFDKLGVSADAKTKLGVIPVGAIFEQGTMPADFLPIIQKGFNLEVLPEKRLQETNLDKVKLKVGGALTTGIANHFFSKKVARMILEYGVGQTLQMGQESLMGGGIAGKLIDGGKDTPASRAAGSLIDQLLN
ncbi:MAG TPA: hypothetical protein PLZ53_05295 [Candidatus Hydrogenedentes bacterium]|jgi:hypothetical protein|nr:hypothetical protein [Candidatus Hydrogenedentota bacterium]HOD94797.1 hypothetical protein [Candidatus Hydrogenedentota bacterium]HOH42510.1 hypothetical protein [Candidatus Hydrogenedentota bacterium]HOR50281.1 hypothetical protein [Candidatus Hydrogenedentota bacterium]HPX85861.1 hypothetical protein [Candidatus Hydrogenedentota bacterium]